jgi:hypothetical protein
MDFLCSQKATYLNLGEIITSTANRIPVLDSLKSILHADTQRLNEILKLFDRYTTTPN